MDFESIVPDKSISLFVKNILVFEEPDEKQKTLLPFFADGYPGLMFQESKNGLLVKPHDKVMPAFFLYGQTIRPIELVLDGKYKLVVFQLYPFVLKSFFKVNPKDLNDDCYNLERLQNKDVTKTIKYLQSNLNTAPMVKAISELLFSIFQAKKESLDFTIGQAIQLILNYKGQFSINELSKELNITERTLERRFVNEVGISPKQFSKIIQFQLSLEQLTIKDYSKLTDVVYANGFADQSHFIKVFKAFTGKTPKMFKRKT
ncbi:MAG: helix-turn-helix domain-containing protein [Ferruginibacter sp.]